MIRHAGALVAAQAGDGERLQDLLRSREAMADISAAERKAAVAPVVPVDPKVIAFAKAQAKGGKRRG